ncbi:hypothetical protein MtrunA17_Chr4g0007161 [Medicago truncatula]|nr:hypothetical protein MtrunA17_Chr4g0007161 [Medicago truncatula]
MRNQKDEKDTEQLKLSLNLKTRMVRQNPNSPWDLHESHKVIPIHYMNDDLKGN